MLVGGDSGGGNYLAVLACVLKVTAKKRKKGRRLFGGKKCTPEKILATLMVSEQLCLQQPFELRERRDD